MFCTSFFDFWGLIIQDFRKNIDFLPKIGLNTAK